MIDLSQHNFLFTELNDLQVELGVKINFKKDLIICMFKKILEG